MSDELHADDTANRTAQSAKPRGDREKPVTREDRIQNNWRCGVCIVRKGARFFRPAAKIATPADRFATVAELDDLCVLASTGSDGDVG
jgi:hypothetical protein